MRSTLMIIDEVDIVPIIIQEEVSDLVYYLFFGSKCITSKIANTNILQGKVNSAIATYMKLRNPDFDSPVIKSIDIVEGTASIIIGVEYNGASLEVPVELTINSIK